jgi:hypothetical protein
MHEPDYSRGTRLYIPRPGSHAAEFIAPGSAIVGHELEDGRIEIYYEGSIYGPHKPFEEKLLHAWDRCVVSYPTIARSILEADELIQVGVVDAITQPRVRWTDDRRTIEQAQHWLNRNATPKLAPLRMAARSTATISGDDSAGSDDHNRRVS